MSRARLNLLIDATIGLAFLVTAVTGVVFLLPASWQAALGLGMPGMLGVPLRAWHWLHDWSGVVAAAGVVLHFALHYRWFVGTTRRWIDGGRPRRARAASAGPTPARAQAPVASSATSVQASTQDRPYQVYRAPQSRGSSDGGGEPGDQRETGGLTRRGFVAAVAGVAAGLAGGAVVVKVASAMTVDRAAGQQSSLTSGATSQGAATAGSSSGGSGSSNGTSSSSNDQSGSSQNGSSQSSTSQGATPQARVAVDTSACTACGRCLQTCPASVFAWNDAGKATAQSPDQCILCHRCVQVCPSSAITLAG